MSVDTHGTHVTCLNIEGTWTSLRRELDSRMGELILLTMIKPITSAYGLPLYAITRGRRMPQDRLSAITHTDVALQFFSFLLALLVLISLMCIC